MPRATLGLQEAMSKAQAACVASGWDVRLAAKKLHGTQDDALPTIMGARAAVLEAQRLLIELHHPT